MIYFQIFIYTILCDQKLWIQILKKSLIKSNQNTIIVGKTVTPVISMVGEGPITSESLAEDTKKVLEEITR